MPDENLETAPEATGQADIQTEQQEPDSTEDSSVDSETTEEKPDAMSQLESLDIDPKLKEEIKSGYLRQSDYTRKTQDISELRKSLLGSQQETQTPAQADYSQPDAQEGMDILRKTIREEFNPFLREFKEMKVDSTLRDVAIRYKEDLPYILPEAQKIASELNVPEDVKTDPKIVNLIMEAARGRVADTIKSKAREEGRIEGNTQADRALKAGSVKQKARQFEGQPSPEEAAKMSADELAKYLTSVI